jgi:hypothetical protein
MSNLTKIIGATALGLGIAVAIPVLGHGFGAGMYGPTGGGWGPGHHMGMLHGEMHHGGGNIEQRLGTLKESLNLTAEQQPAWDQYEQAVKSLSESRPTGHPNWDNAPGETEAHFAQMEQHLAQMKTVFEARKALYETLTDQQKETIDNYMPGPFGHHYSYNG